MRDAGQMLGQGDSEQEGEGEGAWRGEVECVEEPDTGVVKWGKGKR